ncbi:MAG: NAD/NADP octopine/nopaline dehydrogenase family protein, partial [Anaerolineae bacterium]
QTLPWACRIRQYGQEVAILGTKAEVDLTAWPPDVAGEIATLLSELLEVRLQPSASFLSLTLADTGQLIHPGVMYGLFRDWDDRPYAEAPLFYQAIDATTAGILQQLSDEVQILRAALERRLPHVDLCAVRPLDEWLRRSYGDAIADASSLQSCFATNRSYAGLRAPMRPTGGGLVPDFQARYLAEDVPYGLVVTRGIAELAGVATPTMDRVIMWAQKCLGKEYLIEGKLQGGDVASSRAPQRYGFESLDDVRRKT